MALLKFTVAPLKAVAAAARLAGAVHRLAPGVVAFSSSPAALAAEASPAAGASAEAAAVPKDPGYTITEIAVEKSGKSKRTHATGMVEYVKGHTKKLNPLARQVRSGSRVRRCSIPLFSHTLRLTQVAGKSVAEALAQMAFSPSRRAPQLTRAITRAVNAARGPSGLPVAAFKVEQAWTGKHTASQRIRFHSKGRAGRASKRTSKVWVRVAAMSAAEAAKKNRFTAMPTPESIAALDPRAY